MKILTNCRVSAIILFTLLLIALSPSEMFGQGWFNANWAYRKTITIDFTKVVSGPHSNFPVLISRVDSDLQARAQADGDDILFTTSDGVTKLDHELESYSSGTGTVVTWINFPSLSSVSNTIIYMYYGNASASSQQNISGAWNTNYKGVWHMNTSFSDATTNANNGTNTGTTAVTGKISGGRGYVRSNGADYITIPGLLGSPTSFSISAWANLNSADVGGSEILSIGDYTMLRSDEIGSNRTSGIYNTGPGTWTTTGSGNNYAGTGWHYIVYNFDDATNSQKLFVDGLQVGTSSNSSTPVYSGAGSNTFIGKHGNGNNDFDFDGAMDEVRVSNITRSANWIQTEYNNQNSPTTFYSIGAQTATKTFSGIGNFSDATKWTGGTLPTVGQNLIIDGTCTVDNNVGTDNVAYGTLTIGTGTSRTLNWATGGTNRLNITDLKNGTAISSLDMTNGGTVIIRGQILNTTLNYISGSGTIEIRSSMTLPAVPTLNNLTINGSGIIVNLSGDIELTGNLTLTTGTLNSANVAIEISGNWTNNATSTAFAAGNSTVTFNNTNAQTIGGSSVTTFKNLVIDKTSGTATLARNVSISGNLVVNSGIFNLLTYTANRTAVGGNLTVANNATLRIEGTNSFPSNYSLVTLVVASNVEYAGTNQTVASQTYGNLKLSSSSGAAVKTLPVVTLTVIGNMSSAIGTGTSVSYTAIGTVNVNGNVSIGASTTFNGGSSFHTIGGNWTNNGTFNASTGTIALAGTGAQLGGSGAHNFYNLSVSGANFSFSNVPISVASNLTSSGSGSFSQISGGSITMTGSGKVINGSGMTFGNLDITGSITAMTAISISGNLIVSGSLAGNSSITMSGTSKTISGSGTKNLSTLSITGSITTAVNFSISSALTVGGSFSATAGNSTFIGTSSLSGTANLYNVIINGTSLQLSANSVLGIKNTMTLTAGVLNVSSSTPNTVDFNGTGAQNINPITYYNLNLSNGNNKTAIGGITVNRNIIINTGTTFIGGTYTHSIYADWTNNGSFTKGTSTVQFLGNQNTTIVGATTFNVLRVNSSNANTGLILQSNISAAIVDMVLGTINTLTNSLTITTTRIGNGIILGTITRNHAFTTGISYAFEGPDNTITFASVTGVTSITVSVVKETVSDFPYGACIGREYDVEVPSGSYTATLRLHYENIELNGNDETQMGMWNYDGTQWLPIGKTANSSSSNYVEKSGLTNINNRWTCSFDPIVVLWNGSVSNDWNTAANWTVYLGSGSTPPSANDIVVLGGIPFTNQPTISTAVQVKNVVFSDTQAVTLSMSSGGSLVTGDIQGVWLANAQHAINTNNQTITINGNLALSDGLSNHTINLNINSGTVNITGSLTESGDANVTISGTGNLNIGVDYNYINGTFDAGNGTVTYNGIGDQTIAALGYHNLKVDKPSGQASLINTMSITGDLGVLAGELNNVASTTVFGDVTIASGATFHNTDLLEVGGDWINSGNYVGEGTSVIFNGTGTQTISATTFNNLEINKPVGSIAELSGNIIMKGDLAVTSGTLDIKTFDCNRDVSGGTIALGDSATFIVGGNNSPLNFTSGELSHSSTVIADGSGSQLIFGVDFGHLIFRNGGVKTLVSPITVHGDLIIENGATFDGGAHTITLNGNWNNGGSFTPSTGTIICAGASKNILGNTTFNQVTVTGSYEILNDVIFNGLLNITGTGSFTAGSTITTTLHGDLINSGTLYTLGTTTFSGNVLQTLSLINAVTTVAITVNFNGTVSPVLNSTSVPQYGFLNINNTGGINPSVGWNILYSMVVGSGASFNGGLSTHNFLGSVTNNGTITSNGILNFIPAAPTTIQLGTNFTSTGQVMFGGAGATTLSATPVAFNDLIIDKPGSSLAALSALTINGNFLLNDGTFTPSSVIYLAGDWTMNAGTFVPGVHTVVFNGTLDQSIKGYLSSQTFNNVLIYKTPGTLLSTDESVLVLTTKNITETTGNFTAPATLNVNGNFEVVSGTFTAGQNIYFAGNVINDGNYIPNNGTVTFNGTGLDTLSGNATTNFYSIILNKGVDINSILDIQSVINVPAGGLTLVNGLLKLSSASTIQPFENDIATSGSIIPSTSGLWNNGGTINSSDMNWSIAGLLKTSAGTTNIGAAENNVLIPSSTSEIVVQGGNLNIASAISNPGVAWPMTMSAGTLTLNIFGGSISNSAPFNMDATGCVFDMSGGTIVVQNAGGSVGQNLGYNNLSLGGTGFTGGTLQIGNDSTDVNQTIGITSTNPVSNLEIKSTNVIAQLHDSELSVTSDVVITTGELHSNGFDLSIGNNLTNNFSDTAFVAGTDLVTMTGMSSGGMNGTHSITFNDLTINASGNSVHLNSTKETYIKGVVLIPSGTLITQDRLTLFSNSATTASIGEIATAADLTGKVTVQRYIPSTTADQYGSWVAVGCPVQGTTIADWDQDIITTGFTGSDYPQPYPFTNIQWYDETEPGLAGMGYQLVTSTSDSILSDKGYFIYMQIPNQAVDVKGNIYQHTFNRNLEYTNTGSIGDGWNLLVNQYPSEVDFRQMVLNGAGTASYYLYDSESNNYKVYNGLSEVGTAPQYISSSQSFFVQASGPGSFIKYDETFKTNNGTQFERDLPANSFVTFKIASNNGSSDECILHFKEGATNNFEWNYDALKMESMIPTAAECALIANDGTKLSIDAVPLETLEISIPVYVEMPQPGSYTFEVVTVNNLPPGYCLFIEDLVDGTTMPIEAGQMWSFSMTTAYTGNRFVIHASPSVNVVTSNVSCYGNHDGVVDVVVPDGDWSIILFDSDGVVVNAASNDFILENLAPGEYQIEVTNAVELCPVTSVIFSIAEPLEISAELISSSVDQCNNSTNATLEFAVVNMNSEYSYSIQDSQGAVVLNGISTNPQVLLEGLRGDVYSINIDNGCGVMTIIKNVSDPNAVVSEIFSDDIYLDLDNQNSTEVTISQECINATSFFWLLDDEFYSYDDLWIHSFEEPGEHILTLTAQNEFCSASDSISIQIDQTLAIGDFDSNDLITITQSSEELIFAFNESLSENLFVCILDLNGKKVWSNTLQPTQGSRVTIDISQYAKGIYIAHAEVNGLEVMNKKFMPQ